MLPSRLLRFLFPALLLLLACGGSVETASSGSSSGLGSSTTSAGSGGSAATSTTSTTASASGGGGHDGGGGAGGGCQGYIDVSLDKVAYKPLGSICSGSWGAAMSSTPVGYGFAGGPAPGVFGLIIDGCATAAPGSQELRLTATGAMGVGTFTLGSVTYVDPSAGAEDGAAGSSFQLVVTRFDAVGGVIEGSFTGTVGNGDLPLHEVQATLHVCRVADEFAP